MTLGQYLREKRKAKNIGLREMARRTRYDNSTLSKYENDRLRPPVSVLTAYVRYLKLDQRESDEMFALAELLPPDVTPLKIFQAGILEHLR
jgi:transcriptional regulator with XRE-family HTH domain